MSNRCLLFEAPLAGDLLFDEDALKIISNVFFLKAPGTGFVYFCKTNDRTLSNISYTNLSAADPKPQREAKQQRATESRLSWQLEGGSSEAIRRGLRRAANRSSAEQPSGAAQSGARQQKSSTAKQPSVEADQQRIPAEQRAP